MGGGLTGSGLGWSRPRVAREAVLRSKLRRCPVQGLLLAVLSAVLVLAFAAPALATVSTFYVADDLDGARDLDVQSDGASDSIILECSNGAVAVNGQMASSAGSAIPCSGPQRIIALGLGGNDQIDLTRVSRQSGFTSVMHDPHQTSIGDEVYIKAGDGADTVLGGPFGESIDDGDVGTGPDTIHGGGGKDHIVGSYAADRLYGDSGPDSIEGNTGADRIHGGSGNDFLEPAEYSTDRVKLYGDGGSDTLNGAHGNDLLDGGSGNDLMSGGGGKDRMFGRAGKDYIYGEGSADSLFGGTGNDHLFGGRGRDRLVGGPGKDKVKQ
jgi:Ca2+-binding RTX toxin-like protein